MRSLLRRSRGMVHVAAGQSMSPRRAPVASRFGVVVQHRQEGGQLAAIQHAGTFADRNRLLKLGKGTGATPLWPSLSSASPSIRSGPPPLLV
jgi:hypothetical protein